MLNMEYRICFPAIPNMGDLLNKDMLEDLFGISVVQSTISEGGNMLAIGSGLNKLLYSSDKKIKTKQAIRKLFNSKTFYVWGSGFMRYPNGKDNNFIFRNIKFLSLRGELTKRRIENILGKELDVPTGDGGLLANRWLEKMPQPKYRIGIIPHFKEKESPLVHEIKEFYKDSVIIDLSENPKDVVRNIASCEMILSSSLHGLIISDSFHIPNKHIMLYSFGQKMIGDGYKFADYYSSYGLKDIPIDMQKKSRWPSFSDIETSYQVDYDVVEQKKNAISSVFPMQA